MMLNHTTKQQLDLASRLEPGPDRSRFIADQIVSRFVNVFARVTEGQFEQARRLLFQAEMFAAEAHEVEQ